jgi:hypothetical protein
MKNLNEKKQRMIELSNRLFNSMEFALLDNFKSKRGIEYSKCSAELSELQSETRLIYKRMNITGEPKHYEFVSF